MDSSRDFDISENKGADQPPLPKPPQVFIGREIEMYLILKTIFSKWLVNLFGTTWIGRSSLASALCQYINELKSTMTKIKSIFYIHTLQAENTDKMRSVIYPLHKRLLALVKATYLPRGANIDDITQNIYESLSHMKVMVVFDIVEMLELS